MLPRGEKRVGDRNENLDGQSRGEEKDVDRGEVSPL
jgi:hypothetical protein